MTPSMLPRSLCLRAAFSVGLIALSWSAGAAPSGESSRSQALFDFHSGFWVNLHHFLYAQAKAQQQPKSPAVSQADTQILSSLSAQQRLVWNDAVSYYADSLIQHDLLLDQELPVIKQQLERAEASPNLAHAKIPVRLQAVLLEAAPIYRRLWWKRHDAQGSAALEILFHETSHGMMDNVRNAFETAEAAVNARRSSGSFDSGTLWHAVLFYTAGDLVADRITGYVPYADKKGLWVRAWPDPDRSLIAQDWKPHMNGAVDLPQAVTKLVEDLGTASR
jgi:hypothetical protein